MAGVPQMQEQFAAGRHGWRECRKCRSNLRRPPALGSHLLLRTRKDAMSNKIESILESWVFRSRWLLAPFFIGLLLAIVALLLKFLEALWELGINVIALSPEQMIISILSLVDAALIAALLLIIGFSGYENFVSKIGTGEHEDRPAWMGKVGFSDLKIKLMGAIVAISAVELLKAFIKVNELPWQELAWKVGIHLTFVVSGVLFAITDRITERKGER
jgi:uncharacterized protein (TIGR00645 family)